MYEEREIGRDGKRLTEKGKQREKTREGGGRNRERNRERGRGKEIERN